MNPSTMIRMLSAFVFSASLSFAAEPQFGALEKGQRKILQCEIVERTPIGPGLFMDGVDLGHLQLLQNGDRTDIPFELRYTFTDAAGEDYDFSNRDRFPSTMGIVRADELVIEDKEDKTPEELEMDKQKLQMKEFLGYFQGVAAVPAEQEVFGYFIFSDALNLSLSISYLSKEGELLGQGGLLYSNFRYGCKQPKAPESKDEEAKEETEAEEGEADAEESEEDASEQSPN